MTTDIRQKQLQRIRRTGERLGCPDCGLSLFLLSFGLSELLLRIRISLRLTDLETDSLELARNLLGFLVVQLVLESERLELHGLHPAALLGALDQSLDLIGFEQFGQLVLRQEGVSVLSRTPVCTIFMDSMQLCPVFPGLEPRYWLLQAHNAAPATVIPVS